MLTEVLDGFRYPAAHDRALAKRQLGHAFVQKLICLGVGDEGQKRGTAHRQLADARSLYRRGRFEDAPPDFAPSVIRHCGVRGRPRIFSPPTLPTSPLPPRTPIPPTPQPP